MIAMDEFSLINTYFKLPAIARDDVLFGIGDDAACVEVPPGMQLIISTDTLVAGVHFLDNWDAYDIAYKAVMVNISDIAAMAATPCWVSLALTTPDFNFNWMQRFATGLHHALNKYNIALIGGDTTKGPLTVTLTIHGLVPQGKYLRRCGAKIGDVIFVSGELGAASLAVNLLQQKTPILDKIAVDDIDKITLMSKLQQPSPRIDLNFLLRKYASSAIDISDGLSADLNHICVASNVGASLNWHAIPVHPLVNKYESLHAMNYIFSGGDDYELCFTISSAKINEFNEYLKTHKLCCYPIGIIEEQHGLRVSLLNGEIMDYTPSGYCHF